ncbi:MAG: transcriptional regulator [Rhizobiaceae bacterium]|nr:transcriptional regulator [Rhizobiaceae bacterium]
MKLEKITGRRSYGDACGTAHALDLIGERWAMLVMRELLLGPRRFGELRDHLPGLSANVLTQRLEGLEAAGIVRRHRLPPPASVQVYELTAWGMEAEPVILALGRWGARSPFHDPALHLSPVSMMLSFRAMFDPVRAAGIEVTLRFRFGADAYWISIGDGRLTGERGDGPVPDAELSGPPGTIAGMVYGLLPLDELERNGTLKVEGSHAALGRFASIFDLPAKAPLPALA